MPAGPRHAPTVATVLVAALVGLPCAGCGGDDPPALSLGGFSLCAPVPDGDVTAALDSPTLSAGVTSARLTSLTLEHASGVTLLGAYLAPATGQVVGALAGWPPRERTYRPVRLEVQQSVAIPGATLTGSSQRTQVLLHLRKTASHASFDGYRMTYEEDGSTRSVTSTDDVTLETGDCEPG